MNEPTFTIEDLVKMVADHEGSAVRLKTIINELCAKGGLPPRYAATELQQVSSGALDFRSDQFHGRPLATSVREYLEIRRRANIGPATTNEIFDALAKGGYEFGAKNEQIARVSTYNSINKNPAFYKLPNKKWGLREWYPNVKHETETNGESVIGESSKDASFGRKRRAKSGSSKSSGKKESGMTRIVKVLESDPSKQWAYSEILEKVPGLKKSSAAAFLFKLQREGKATKVGTGLWQTKK